MNEDKEINKEDKALLEYLKQEESKMFTEYWWFSHCFTERNNKENPTRFTLLSELDH
jgi:hypothetical protein